MTHSPPVNPAPQETRLRNAGGENKNQKYVRIMNSHANERSIIRRRDAIRRVEDLLAEWIASDKSHGYIERTEDHAGFISQRVLGGSA